MSELAKLIPIGTFIDHDRPSPDAVRTGPDISPAFDAYRALLPGRPPHRPGARETGYQFPGMRSSCQLGPGDAHSGAARTPSSPRRAAGRRSQPVILRKSALDRRSTSVTGQFRFLDVSDLSGKPQLQARLPEVTGGTGVDLAAPPRRPRRRRSRDPRSVRATVAVRMNNGLTKGGRAPSRRCTTSRASRMCGSCTSRATRAPTGIFPTPSSRTGTRRPRTGSGSRRTRTARSAFYGSAHPTVEELPAAACATSLHESGPAPRSGPAGRPGRGAPGLRRASFS